MRRFKPFVPPVGWAKYAGDCLFCGERIGVGEPCEFWFQRDCRGIAHIGCLERWLSVSGWEQSSSLVLVD